jgi:hypothetical protein
MALVIGYSRQGMSAYHAPHISGDESMTTDLIRWPATTLLGLAMMIASVGWAREIATTTPERAGMSSER